MVCKLDQQGEDAIVRREGGYRLTAYRDSVGVLTIGAGHTGRASPPVVVPGMTIPLTQAKALFRTDVEPVEAGVYALLDGEPTQNQFNALVSLTHNIGIPHFRESTVLRRCNAGDLDAAADAFMMWDKAKNAKTGQLETVRGLTNRRREERSQFLTPDGTGLVEAPAPQISRGPPLARGVPAGVVIDADLGFWARGGRALAYWLFAIPIEDHPS